MNVPEDILSGAKNTSANADIITKVQGYRWAV